jgi:hypothetical protein
LYSVPTADKGFFGFLWSTGLAWLGLAPLCAPYPPGTAGCSSARGTSEPSRRYLNHIFTTYSIRNFPFTYLLRRLVQHDLSHCSHHGVSAAPQLARGSLRVSGVTVFLPVDTGLQLLWEPNLQTAISQSVSLTTSESTLWNRLWPSVLLQHPTGRFTFAEAQKAHPEHSHVSK